MKNRFLKFCEIGPRSDHKFHSVENYILTKPLSIKLANWRFPSMKPVCSLNKLLTLHMCMYLMRGCQTSRHLMNEWSAKNSEYKTTMPGPGVASCH